MGPAASAVPFRRLPVGTLRTPAALPPRRQPRAPRHTQHVLCLCTPPRGSKRSSAVRGQYPLSLGSPQIRRSLSSQAQQAEHSGPGLALRAVAAAEGIHARDASPPSTSAWQAEGAGDARTDWGRRRGKKNGRPKSGPRRGGRGRNSERKNWKNVVPCSEDELCLAFSTDARMVAAYIGKGGALSHKVLTGIKPNIFNLALRSQVDLQVAQAALKAMVEASVANDHSFAAFFNLCAGSAHPHQAVNFWRSISSGSEYKQLSPISTNALLSAACFARDSSLPLQLMEEMSAAGCPLCRLCYNMVLDHCAKVRDLDGALYLFRQMRPKESTPAGGEKASDISPDCFTYSALLKAVVRTQRFELLYNVHQLVVESDAPADAHLWSSLAAAYAKDRNFEEALGILQRLSEEEPHAKKELMSGYNNVLSVMGRLGMFEEAWEVYLECLTSSKIGLQGDDVTFVCLLNAAYRSRCQSEATVESLHREMLSVCGSYTIQLLTALLNCYRSVLGLSNEQRLAKVDEMFSFICDIGLKPTTTTHNSVMTAHLDCGDVAGVVEHFHAVQGTGVALDKISFKILIQAYDLLDMPEKVEEMQMLQQSMSFITNKRPR